MDSLQKAFERHQLGLAYKAITAQMGPSAQLVAFVNYDRVTSDSLGLESFNIMDQHQAILAEIETDPSWSIAVEGLGSKIQSLIAKVKKPKEVPVNLDNITASTKLEKISSKQRVFYRDETEELIGVVKKAIEQLKWAEGKSPKTRDVVTWSKFFDSTIKNYDHNEFLSRGSKIYSLYDLESKQHVRNSTADVNEAGWNEQNFKQTTVEFRGVILAYESARTAILDELGIAEEVINDLGSRKDVEGVKAYKAVSCVLTLLCNSVQVGDHALIDAVAMMGRVASHFKEVA